MLKSTNKFENLDILNNIPPNKDDDPPTQIKQPTILALEPAAKRQASSRSSSKPYASVVKENGCSPNVPSSNVNTLVNNVFKPITKDELSKAINIVEADKIMQEVISLGDSQPIKVTHRKKRVNKPVVGSMEDNAISFKGVQKLAFLHVHNVEPNTPESELLKHLKPLFPEATCVKLTSKHPNLYSSYKVTLYEHNLKAAMCPSNWPKDTYVNRFFHPRIRRPATE